MGDTCPLCSDFEKINIGQNFLSVFLFPLDISQASALPQDSYRIYTAGQASPHCNPETSG